MAAMAGTAPALPSRHPGRVYRIETTNIGPPPQPLSDELIDLWEHATLLFYGYEWQASAENFLYLSAIIDRRHESAQCLLNAAIIFARIGDFAVASEALEGAQKSDDFRALALYFSGHVEFQTGELRKSESFFLAALETLGGKRIHFARMGLDFTLEPSKIQHVLEAFDLRAMPLDSIPSLGVEALPADSVFEAPQRLPDSGYASPQSPTKSIISTRQSEEDSSRKPIKRTPKALLAQSNRDYSNPPVSHNLRSLEYSKGDVQWHEPVGAPQPTPAAPLTPRRSIKTIGGLVRQFSGRRRNTSDLSKKSSTASFRTGLLARLVPREAKVRDDSVSDLAGFIRDLPSRHSVDEAHEAVIQHSHVTDFAEPSSVSLSPTQAMQTPVEFQTENHHYTNSSEADESANCTGPSVREDHETNSTLNHDSI